ncbi:hypothetical protein CHGG_05653 [Chaetomium globosum CBS 148.51]|uniref:Chloride channel protein n=1 Tax=Chaetomium globosum (strain ATCC 6205 / CBS 148.51 / DSM 1962 / NBRC 6347 / NRRL 1970) TaxID=306901 RepID=Q2H6R2_CHAGB|nr:uncharacterized protein CHGG_05653 [Chaetomium globosum CBS 148.51]EAQ89034.1 hypothetical protein CHGG_05653 [Chaetomium globosum CBS 148.51]
MASRRYGVRLPDIVAAGNSNNDGSGADSSTGTEQQGQYLSLPSSPTNVRRPRPNMSRRPSTNEPIDERSPLLGAARPSRIRIHSAHGSPRVPLLSRNQSYADSVRSIRHHSRANSWGTRLMHALSDRQESSMADSKGSLYPDDRVWYDQFTSTDWVHDSIADAYRVKALRSRKDFWGRVYVLFDGAQGLAAERPRRVYRRRPGKCCPPRSLYGLAGLDGVAEVRVILSGFVLHGFLGLKTLIIKTLGLILSVASGLSLGKEGPYVHIATCVGNIACRLFTKYDRNDAKRREVLSAAAAAGVAVAFGAPLGGVLFGLEEVAYFFPAKTLFRTFFCCITAALTLKFLNPYGTQKIVMFQVRYLVDWEYFEIISFILVGVFGGAAGALFIKASRHWAKTFRRIPAIKAYPLLEVVLVALVTGLIGYWNTLTKLPVAKLLYNLAAPCDDRDNNLEDLGLCPEEIGDIPPILLNLLTAFLIKGFLTIITFGIKLPAGIYVPSMVVGGLMGRLVGHVVQWVVMATPDWGVWGTCAKMPNATCIQPGVYGLIAAGSTMCGVTRLSVTLAVILFELTGSLDYVLPFSLAILVAKWTADAIEPLSIYDLLTEMNSYPYLNNKHKPIFTSDLADIVPRVRKERIIDITTSPVVPALSLRAKLELLHKAGELDGGLPIVRDGILVGLIPAPDLEYALDNLRDEPSSLCLMAPVPSIDDSDDGLPDPTDFTPFIDPAPVALDIRSPMDLVYECFVKLGLRYICVLRDGRYAGMTHKKTFVKYMRELEEKEGHM